MGDIDDILLGADPEDILLGKEPDWLKPIRTLAIVLGVCIVGNIFLSMFIEEYRLQALMQETRSISLNGIQCAVEEMQDIGEDISYLFDDDGFITDSYKEYLESLDSIDGDKEIKNVVNLLRNGNSNGEMYTPLSFNLTYLDKAKLEELIDRNLKDIFDANNSTEYSRGRISNGGIVEELIMGSERTEYIDCEVIVEDMKVIDITDVKKCNEEEKAMYRAVYGSEDPLLSKPDGLGLTENHYLIVYQVKYLVTWQPYTSTFFFQRKDSKYKKNSDGFLALPEITDEYTALYYVTN